MQSAEAKGLSDSSQAVKPLPQRNIAVDAYRGLVMLLMMAEVLRFSKVAQAFPNSLFWHSTRRTCNGSA